MKTNLQTLFLLLTSIVTFASAYIVPIPSGGYYSNNVVQNVSISVGKTVYLNCSLQTTIAEHHLADFFEYSSLGQTTVPPPSNELGLLLSNPTWLKADFVYNQNGVVESHRTENIIVTRKGVVADSLRDKVKLIQPPSGDRVQVLRISDVEVKDEGKYICRELSANIDRSFFLSVFCKFY